MNLGPHQSHIKVYLSILDKFANHLYRQSLLVYKRRNVYELGTIELFFFIAGRFLLTTGRFKLTMIGGRHNSTIVLIRWMPQLEPSFCWAIFVNIRSLRTLRSVNVPMFATIVRIDFKSNLNNLKLSRLFRTSYIKEHFLFKI